MKSRPDFGSKDHDAAGNSTDWNPDNPLEGTGSRLARAPKGTSPALPLESSVELHLVRHGETETNARGVITGAKDVALTEKGMAQAREIGRHLDPCYDLGFHSTLSRSRDTLRLPAMFLSVKCSRTLD